MNRHCLYIAISAALLSGCTTSMAMKMATARMPTSQYNPIPTSTNQNQDYFNMISTVENKVVSDDLGTYYHKIEKDTIYKATLLKEDSTALQSLFNNDIGLLEPVYVINANNPAEWYPDWDLTQKRYDALSKDLKIKLLPMTVTKKYNKLLQDYAYKKATARAESFSKGGLSLITSSFSAMNQVATGKSMLNNKEYYDEVLKPITEKYAYVVSTTVPTAMYFGSMQNKYLSEALLVIAKQRGMTKDMQPSELGADKTKTQEIFEYNGHIAMMPAIIASPISYIPLTSIQQAISGTDTRFLYTGCSSFNLDSANKLFTEQMSTSSATKTALSASFTLNTQANRDEQERKLQQEKNKLAAMVGTYKQSQDAILKNCVNGFKKLNVSGAFSSVKLN